VARYNWCQGSVPACGPAVEKHWSTGWSIGRERRNIPEHILEPVYTYSLTHIDSDDDDDDIDCGGGDGGDDGDKK